MRTKLISLFLATLICVFSCWIPIYAIEQSEATEATIVGAELMLNNDIDLIVTATVSVNTTDVRMRFLVENKSAAITVKGVKEPDLPQYQFTYTGLLPQNMTDDIQMELLIDGTIVATKHYSVREYCLHKLNDETSSPQLKTLVEAMLHYGAAAQMFCEYRVGSLANQSLTAPIYDFSAIAQEITESITTSGTSVWKSASVLLESQVALKVVTTKKDNNFTIYQTGDSLADTCTPDDSGAIYYRGICPNELDRDIVITYWGYSNPAKVNVSVNACLNSLLSDASISIAVKTLAASLYQYGLAEKAYTE